MQKTNQTQHLTDIPVANDSALRLMRSAAQSNAKVTNRVLLIIWDGSPADNIENLFRGRGYKTLRQYMGNVNNQCQLSLQAYSAVVHVARTSDVLEQKFFDFSLPATMEEYALIATDESDDIHCLVSVSETVPHDLRLYVRWLWSMCAVS